MKITFVGDIMLGRQIAAEQAVSPDPILESPVVEKIRQADFIVGNLESPLLSEGGDDMDHMQFQGCPELLSQFPFIDCFVLANNHINDFGNQLIGQTVDALDAASLKWNGVYSDKYKPFLFESEGRKIALFSCTDMMNEKIPDDAPWQVPHVDDEWFSSLISEYSRQGYFVILYAHVGMLFTRFPNPPIRDLMHKMVDAGADMIVTVHPHVVGGVEVYNGKPIFYSLGDFVMDGSSDRRRRSVILEVSVENGEVASWEITPARINQKLRTELAAGARKRKVIRSWKSVSRKVENNSGRYEGFFARQYRVEMLQHIGSTVCFLLKEKGVLGLLHLLFKRAEEVKMMRRWAVEDRSALRMDDDAIRKDRKRLSNKDLYG